jgi:hypothetical protein
MVMAVGHVEFFRTLPSVLGCPHARVDACEAVLRDGGHPVRILLGPERVRTVGALRLPETPVRVEMPEHGDAEADAFMARFLGAFRRAGG